MRILLILLSLVLQWNVSGNSVNIPTENCVQKTLTSENNGINGGSDWFFRHQGQYHDSETGLCYNRHRYYNPDSGNYLSQDPIGLNGGIALYAYVHDPNNWIDVFGLTGTYIFTDGKTSYIGKGPANRMNTSMNQHIGGKDNAIAKTHIDFGDNDMGLMVEHKLMSDYKAVEVGNKAFDNKINSPGKKKYDAATPEVRAKVDAEAAKIKADFEGQKVKLCK
jgi:RHS repeat-associated protein